MFKVRHVRVDERVQLMMRAELSTEKIAERAGELRRLLRYAPDEIISPVDAIRRLKSEIPKFKLIIVDDRVLPKCFAVANYSDRIITVRRSVWEFANAGNPHDNFTLLEELGHYALAHPGQRNRTIGADHSAQVNKEVAMYEREARHFAGIFAVSMEAANHLQAASHIRLKSCLSERAAKIRWDEIERERRRRSGKNRPISVRGARAMIAMNKRWRGIRSVDIEQLQRQVQEDEARRGAVAMDYTGDKCCRCGDRKLRSDGRTICCENCGWPPDGDCELS